jgi:hypothetical protein
LATIAAAPTKTTPVARNGPMAGRFTSLPVCFV